VSNIRKADLIGANRQAVRMRVMRCPSGLSTSKARRVACDDLIWRSDRWLRVGQWLVIVSCDGWRIVVLRYVELQMKSVSEEIKLGNVVDRRMFWLCCCGLWTVSTTDSIQNTTLSVANTETRGILTLSDSCSKKLLVRSSSRSSPGLRKVVEFT
jgi:hypothetical protein